MPRAPPRGKLTGTGQKKKLRRQNTTLNFSVRLAQEKVTELEAQAKELRSRLRRSEAAREAGLGATRATQAWLREGIKLVYEKYNPRQVPRIDDIFAKYTDQEALLMLRLLQRHLQT